MDARGGRPSLFVDPSKIERIVENLVMNAVRHTSPEVAIWVKLWPQDGGAVIAVEDDGPGVPHAIRGEIFEPFRQGPTASAHSPRHPDRPLARGDVRRAARRAGLGGGP